MNYISCPVRLHGRFMPFSPLQIIASRFTGFTQTRPIRRGWACSVSSGILNGMSQNYSDEDFKKLLREISKRFAIAGLVVIALGAAIIGFMYLFYGGIHQ